LRNRFGDHFEHAVRVGKNVVVPKSQNAKTSISQVGVARYVSLALRVLSAVRFDDKFAFKIDEIDDPRTERNLTPKFRARELPRSQKPPQLLLGVCR
jgi:hypothetical protein